jgi:hypothetical protein
MIKLEHYRRAEGLDGPMCSPYDLEIGAFGVDLD